MSMRKKRYDVSDFLTKADVKAAVDVLKDAVRTKKDRIAAEIIVNHATGTPTGKPQPKGEETGKPVVTFNLPPKYSELKEQMREEARQEMLAEAKAGEVVQPPQLEEGKVPRPPKGSRPRGGVATRFKAKEGLTIVQPEVLHDGARPKDGGA